ncbi:MAG TPA: hypothetical protein VIK64_16030 [Anaerolineales bacterium]
MVKTSSARLNVMLLIILLGILFLITGSLHPASADGGGFPTATLTPSITPSPTIIPTATPTIAPTLTPTVTPFPLQPELQEQLLEPSPTPVPARPSAGILCWPIAVVLVLLVIILSTWLFSRRGSPFR